RIADHLEREIRFHRPAPVEGAVAKQRPAAMRALNAAQIGGNATFERRIDLFAEIMAQQHIFRRDGGVRLKLEQKMAVGVLLRQQRLRSGIDMGIEIGHRTVMAESLAESLAPSSTAYWRRVRRRGCPSESHLRWSRASRYLSNRRRARDCASASACPGVFDPAPGLRRKWRGVRARSAKAVIQLAAPAAVRSPPPLPPR